MKESRLRVAIIGTGRIANDAHIPALKALEGRVELAAVCSRRAEAAEAMAKAHGFSCWYTDCEHMLQEQHPDLVCVCTSNQSHVPLARLALENGAHVVCEKPLSISYADAKALYQRADECGRALVACQNMRYEPGVLLARDLVCRGELGDVYYAELTHLRRRGIPDWGGFRSKAENGGGCMCDLGVHRLDALLWIMGNPGFTSITGYADTHIGNLDSSVMDVEEFVAGSILLENGCHINFKISWAVNLPDMREMILAGTRAGIRLPEGIVYSDYAGKQSEIHLHSTIKERPWNAGHSDLIRDVANHIQFGKPLPVLPEETLNVTRILDAFYRSASEHREVTALEVL